MTTLENYVPPKTKVYKIPADKLTQASDLCLFSALNFWQSANYVREKGALHIAKGLLLLAIEELGKIVLLREAHGEQDRDYFSVDEKSFKSHRLKLEKGRKLFAKWGLDLDELEIPLTKEERERLWFVSWNEDTQEFERRLTGPTIVNIDAFQEIVRQGWNKMRQEEKFRLSKN